LLQQEFGIPGEDVLGLDAHEIVPGPVPVQVGGKPVRVPEPGTLQFVAHAAGVGEPGLLHPLRE